jgi:hypothetical protein
MILEAGINFFKGDHKTGKTHFMWNLSSYLESLGKKICFIGGTNEHEDDSMFLRTFEFSFFRKNDIRTFELALQLRNSYDYIVIDNIDYINDDYIQILFKSKKTIICTCSKNRVYTKINYPHQNFYIKNDYIELPNGDEVTMNNLFKSLRREDKINLILNDKS